MTGAVTVKTLQRVAESLDCVFVYGFVPRTSLASTVRRQVQGVAAKRLEKASQTMALENQALRQKENQKILSDMVDDLTDKPPKNLWG